MKPFLTTLLLAALLLMGMQACCPLVKNKLGEAVLSDADRKWIPYTSNATLKFKDANGTVIQVNTGTKTVDTKKVNTTMKEACDYYVVEYEEITVGSNPNYSFRLNLEGMQQYGASDTPVFTITTYLGAQENLTSYFIFPQPLNAVCDSQTETFSCANSVVIDGNTVNDVYKLVSDDYSLDGTTLKIKTLYYHKEKGIVKYILDNGVEWTLTNL